MTTSPPFTPTRAAFFNENDGLYRKKWTVLECQFLVDSNLLEPGKFELLDGEIIYKMGQSIEHKACVTGIVVTVSEVFDPRAILNQSDIDIGDHDEFNDPEPDVAVLRKRVRDFIGGAIDPSKDVALVIEAALSTLQGDRTKKARVYGQQGIPEYWIVAIEKRELIVHRQPNTVDGGYADVRTYAETDAVSPLARPDATILVADLLS